MGRVAVFTTPEAAVCPQRRRRLAPSLAFLQLPYCVAFITWDTFISHWPSSVGVDLMPPLNSSYPSFSCCTWWSIKNSKCLGEAFLKEPFYEWFYTEFLCIISVSLFSLIYLKCLYSHTRFSYEGAYLYIQSHFQSYEFKQELSILWKKNSILARWEASWRQRQCPKDPSYNPAASSRESGREREGHGFTC